MSKIWSSEFQETYFEVHQLLLLKDNFCYLLVANNKAIVVDPSVGRPVLNKLKELDLQVEAVFVTHHHSDHIGGASSIQSHYSCPVIGPQHPSLSIVSQDVVGGDENDIGPFTFETIALPGHTPDHVGYHFPECSLLFCGDALFLAGCGRMFEGTPAEYFQSMQKIKDLPPKTLILCGHDYIERNTAFAKTVLKEAMPHQSGEHTTFRTLEEEQRCNPFLQAKTVEEFQKLREALDQF